MAQQREDSPPHNSPKDTGYSAEAKSQDAVKTLTSFGSYISQLDSLDPDAYTAQLESKNTEDYIAHLKTLSKDDLDEELTNTTARTLVEDHCGFLIIQDRFYGALSIIDDILFKIAPHSPEYVKLHATCNFGIKKYNSALQDLSRLAEHTLTTLNQRSFIYERQAAVNSALEDIEAALKFVPIYIDDYEAILECLERKRSIFWGLNKPTDELEGVIQTKKSALEALKKSHLTGKSELANLKESSVSRDAAAKHSSSAESSASSYQGKLFDKSHVVEDKKALCDEQSSKSRVNEARDQRGSQFRRAFSVGATTDQGPAQRRRFG